MFKQGDVCIVNEKAKEEIQGRYRSIIGKRVKVLSKALLDRYNVMVLDPTELWETTEIRLRKDFLTKEDT